MPRDQQRLICLSSANENSSVSEAVAVANRDGHAAAIPLFEELVNCGETVGNCYLGMIYEYGSSDVNANYEHALFYYQQAANDGWVAGPIGLGRIYYYGLGVKRDLAKAFDCFFQIHLAQVANPIADYYIGQMYELGEGTTSDFNKAEFFLKRSLESGFQFARVRLASIARKKKNYARWIGIRIAMVTRPIYFLLKFGAGDWRVGLPTSTMGPASISISAVENTPP